MLWGSTLEELYDILQIYLKVYENKRKTEMEKLETTCYVNGIYMLRAIAPFFGGEKFPEKPIGILVDVKEQEKKLTLQELRQIEENKIRQYMSGGGINGRQIRNNNRR